MVKITLFKKTNLQVDCKSRHSCSCPESNSPTAGVMRCIYFKLRQSKTFEMVFIVCTVVSVCFVTWSIAAPGRCAIRQMNMAVILLTCIPLIQVSNLLPIILGKMGKSVLWFGSRVPEWTKAIPWLRWLVADLSPQKSGFDPRPGHASYMVDKLEPGQVFLRELPYSRDTIVAPVLYAPVSFVYKLIK